MKIHGICLVKNEADILRYFLRESARWCDHIHVFDNGSDDGTWELAQTLSRELPQVVPFRQHDAPFDDALRAEVFNHCRAAAQPGDWWCRLDADEIYIDDPRAFLARVPALHHVVWTAHLQYYLTAGDLERLPGSAETQPPEMTAELLPRWYVANAAEARFFRHRRGLEWTGGAWPRHLGVVTPERIRVQHFQYRSPAQVQRRLDTRRRAAERGWQHFGHSLEKHWREKLADSRELQLDRGDGRYVIDFDHLPRPAEAAWQRPLKLFLHAAGIWP